MFSVSAFEIATVIGSLDFSILFLGASLFLLSRSDSPHPRTC